MLGEVLQALRDDPEDKLPYATYQACLDCVNKHPESEQRFEQYLRFVTNFAQRVAEDGAQLNVPLDLDAYDTVARSVSAALMLRDEPITGHEAREIAEMVSDLLRHSKTMARLLSTFSRSDGSVVEWMIEVLEKFKRCVDLAAEKDLSFRIDF